MRRGSGGTGPAVCGSREWGYWACWDRPQELRLAELQLQPIQPSPERERVAVGYMLRHTATDTQKDIRSPLHTNTHKRRLSGPVPCVSAVPASPPHPPQPLRPGPPAYATPFHPLLPPPPPLLLPAGSLCGLISGEIGELQARAHTHTHTTPPPPPHIHIQCVN